MSADYQNTINNLIILQEFNKDPSKFKLGVYKGRHYFLMSQQSNLVKKIWYLFLEHILRLVKTDETSIQALNKITSEEQKQDNFKFFITSSQEMFDQQKKELNKIKFLNQDLVDKTISYKQEIKILQDHAHKKAEEIVCLKEELEKLQSENEKLNVKVKQFEKNKEEFVHLKSEYKGDYEHLLAQLAEKQNELAQLKEQFEKMAKEIKDPESALSLNALQSQGEKQWSRLDTILKMKRLKSPYIEELFRLIIKHEGNDRYYSTLWDRLKSEKIKF